MILRLCLFVRDQPLAKKRREIFLGNEMTRLLTPIIFARKVLRKFRALVLGLPDNLLRLRLKRIYTKGQAVSSRSIL